MNVTPKLLESEMAEFMKKITIAVRVQLDKYLNGTPAWSGVEIEAQFGFPKNRQSEIKDPVKYPDTIVSKPLIRKLIAGGFITVKQIENTVVLSERERNHLFQLSIHEDKNLHDALVEATEAGCSLDEISRVIRELACKDQS
jgi:hypothetical protein